MQRIALVLLALALPAAASAQQAARSPHGTIPRDLDCSACHSAEGWRPLRRDPRFDHARDARFRLEGAHAAVSCAGCHAGLRFDQPRVSAEDCAGCHTDPHRARLSRDCTRCHDTRSFAAARTPLTHEATTFPLTGAHRVIACEACHRDERAGAFTPVDARCIACHRRDLSRATFPDHSSPAFQAACEACHRTTGWQGARFDHAGVSGFELIGAHRRIDCSSCHVPPDFHLRFTAASPQDCIACHRADYDRQHTGTGFSLQCTTCHTIDTWSGAKFDHAFPIFSGRHAGVWQACTDCHTSPTNFAVFTCLTCHNRAETDSHHREVRDYAYDSVRCLACHPRGEAE